jgi:acyl-CoA thioesterase-1
MPQRNFLPRRVSFRRIAVSCLLAFSVTSAGCHRDRAMESEDANAGAAAVAAAPAPAVVFLGDSLTAGFGLAEDEALPALIQGRVDSARLPYHVINAGRSGDTSAGGLARIDWYFKDSVDLRALVIGLGSNDAMRGLPVETLEANLREIIHRTRQRKPQAKIFLWELKTFPNLGQTYAEQYAAVFPRVAQSENVVLIPFPLEPVAARPELNQSDGIHPRPRVRGWWRTASGQRSAPPCERTSSHTSSRTFSHTSA